MRIRMYACMYIRLLFSIGRICFMYVYTHMHAYTLSRIRLYVWIGIGRCSRHIYFTYAYVCM